MFPLSVQLEIAYQILLIISTKFIVFSMSSNPANKQMHLLFSKYILANYSVSIATQIKNNSV